jgi:AcrR family transcriptional regulator
MAKTQAQRRSETLEKLHVATVKVIVNKGFSRLTTNDIAQEASLSQGALFRYYPTKLAVVVGATYYLLDKVMGDFSRLMDSSKKPSLEKLINDLWEWYKSPDFTAVNRLYAEASADTELKEGIMPAVNAHGRNIEKLLVRLFPDEKTKMLRTAAHAVIFLMTGIASSRHLVDSDILENEILSAVRQFAAFVASGNMTEGSLWNK